GAQRHDFKGRPGANVIDFSTEWLVDEEAFQALKRMSEGLGWDAAVKATAGNGYVKTLQNSDDTLHLLDQHLAEASSSVYVKSDRFGKRTKLDPRDLERNLKQIREARRSSDWVIFSMHHHEYGEKFTDVAEHIEVLARAAI